MEERNQRQLPTAESDRSVRSFMKHATWAENKSSKSAVGVLPVEPAAEGGCSRKT